MKKIKLFALTALFAMLGTNAFAAVKYAIKDGVWYSYNDAAAGTEAEPYEATVFAVALDEEDAITELSIPASFQWTSPSNKKMYFKVKGFDANWAKQGITNIEGEDVEFDVAIIVTLNTLTVNIDNFEAAGFANMCAGLKRLSSLTLIDSKKDDAGAWAPTLFTVGDLDLSELVTNTLVSLDLAKTGIKEIGASAFKFGGATGKTKAWKKLTSIALPEGLNTIGANAFEGFKGTEIAFPAKLATIGASAFKNATGFTAITIPAATTTIDANAFEGCTAVTSITFSTYPSGAKTGKSDVATIGADAFKGAAKVTTVDLSKTDITDGLGAAFSGCTGITAITLSDNVTKLVANLFKDTKVEEITALGAEEVQKVMGADKDHKNTTLKKVTLGPVVTMSPEAFAYCSALEEVTVDFDAAAAADKLGGAALDEAKAQKDYDDAVEALALAQDELGTKEDELEDAQDAFTAASAAFAAAQEAEGEFMLAVAGVNSGLSIYAEAPAPTAEEIATAIAAVPALLDQYKAWVALQDAILAIIDMDATDAIDDEEEAITWANDEANAEDALAIAYKKAAADENLPLADPSDDLRVALLDAGLIAAAEDVDTDGELATFVEGYDVDEDDFAAVATAFAALEAVLDGSTMEELGAAKGLALDNLGTAINNVADAQADVNDAREAKNDAEAALELAKLGADAGIIPEKAFYYNTALATFNYSPENGDYKYVNDNAFLGCSSKPLVHFVTSTIYQSTFPNAPFQTTYNDEAATTITTKADKGTSGKFFAKFHATSKVSIDPNDAKVYSVYVDEGIAYFQALTKKDKTYVIDAEQSVIIKTDEEKEIEVSPYNGTAKQSSVLIDEIYCFDADKDLADFQAEELEAGEYVYRLTNNAATGGFGFTYFTGSTLKKDQFFIISTLAPAAGGRIVKEIWLDEDGNVESVDELTGISTISAEASSNGAIYNVGGQKVSKSYKGLVIKDGKKYIQK